MNIALSAVVIFILLISPIAFYLSFSYGRFPKAGPKFTLLDGMLASAIISLFVHSIALWILWNQEIRFDLFLKILGGEVKDIHVDNRSFARYIRSFALYNAIILVIFILLGRLVRWIVRIWYNHGQIELLRLNNRWWYFFNGLESDIETFDLVFVDAVVDTKEATLIYSGFLINFVCEGEKLNRIYLGDVVRRRLGTQDAELIEISVPGEIFSISAEHIINMNLRFILLEENRPESDAEGQTTDTQ